MGNMNSFAQDSTNSPGDGGRKFWITLYRFPRFRESPFLLPRIREFPFFVPRFREFKNFRDPRFLIFYSENPRNFIFASENPRFTIAATYPLQPPPMGQVKVSTPLRICTFKKERSPAVAHNKKRKFFDASLFVSENFHFCFRESENFHFCFRESEN